MKHRKRTQVRRRVKSNRKKTLTRHKIKGGRKLSRKRTRVRRKTKGGKRQVRKRTRSRRKIKGGVNWRMTPILGNRAARRAAEAEEARRAAAAAEAEEARRAAEAARRAWEEIPASESPPQAKSRLAKLMSRSRGQDWKNLNNEHKQMGIEEQRQLVALENPWKGGQDGEKSLTNLLKRSEERLKNRENPALWAAQQEKFAEERERARRAPPPSRLGQIWNAVKK